MTTSISPRALTLAASIGWRHVTADPVRALLLAWRVLPAPLRGSLRLAGPYGRAAMLWGEGDRPAALGVLAGSPRRQAVFALAADQPAAAAVAGRNAGRVGELASRLYCSAGHCSGLYESPLRRSSRSTR